MSDYEPWSVGAVTTPTARKEHTCYECGRAIRPGVRYELVKGCWDGSWSTFKTCLPCRDLRDTLMNESDRDGFVYGCLAEDADYAGVSFPPGGAS